MNKGMFKGCKEVFSFTFKQNVKNKSFKIAIISLSILMFVLFFGINIGVGYYKSRDKKDTNKEINNIKSVYILDNSKIEGMEISKFKEFDEYLSEKNICIISEEDEIEDLLKKADEAEDKIVVFEISYNLDKKEYEILVKQSSECDDKNVEEIAEQFQEFFGEQKLILSGIEEVKMNLIMSNNSFHTINIDESDKSITEIMIEILLPMLVILAMYMLILLNGQSIGKNIMMEKNSKLMETLLISVKPYAIIAGKILAMYLIAVIEIIVWIISGILGYLMSDNIATMLFDNYKNPISGIIGIIQKHSATAFSTQAIILSILSVFIGFMAYCVLAGLITSNITKAEDLANGTGVFQIIVVVGYLLSYFIPLVDVSENILRIMRYVPITSAFMLPSDILLGNISIVGSVISMCILIVSIFIMILFTGKIYKKKLF